MPPSTEAFRTVYKGINKSALQWFPKHMNSGMKQMQAKLRSVDCILEVHDARIPLSGRNPSLFQQMVGPKPHILVMNKADLITQSEKDKIVEIMTNQQGSLLGSYLREDSIVFTNSRNDKCNGIKEMIPKMCDKIAKSDRFHRSSSREYHAMIIGIPNVGKSSLINMLRSRNLKKGKAVKVGPSAGVTKCVHEKVKISTSPIIFLFDTPGILQPKVPNVISGMKLAACANLPDTHVGLVYISDYILFELNKRGLYHYTKFVGLQEPVDCIATVLSSYATIQNLVNKVHCPGSNTYVTKPDLEACATHFIQAYRKGQFGKFVLDDIGSIEDVSRVFNEHIETYDAAENLDLGTNNLDPSLKRPNMIHQMAK